MNEVATARVDGSAQQSGAARPSFCREFDRVPQFNGRYFAIGAIEPTVRRSCESNCWIGCRE
jgi:hypothetical protein